jgi:hypothetical protein
MKVGVLELIAYTVPPEWARRRIASMLMKHLYSIMPQVVTNWCRRAGHAVNYATYHGQADPVSLLPADLDVVFISAATQTSGLAYALANYYRSMGVRTVLGGPHAKCFPSDAVRFFDVVVKSCTRAQVEDIVKGEFAPGSIVTTDERLTDFPTVEERLPDIAKAEGWADPKKPGRLAVVSLLSSIGCPYTCNFCTEWASPYRPLPADRLTADLRFIAKNLPNAVIGYHDPNFAVRFDQTLDAIEASGVRPNRYVMECSLSVLHGDRLSRLKKTNCIYVAPGVESWFDYGNKATASGKQGRAKLELVANHFRRVREFVPGMQANFLFGSDEDRGVEPAELTKEFARSLPFVWPNVNIPTPYGSTPLYDRYLAEGRILPSMPLAFYCMPYLATTLKNYDPVTYYRHMVEIYQKATSLTGFLKRALMRGPWLIRGVHLVQSVSHGVQVREMREVLKLLETDQKFLAFHERRSNELPEFYHHRYNQRLGRYAELVPRSVRTPVPELPTTRPAPLRLVELGTKRIDRE